MTFWRCRFPVSATFHGEITYQKNLWKNLKVLPSFSLKVLNPSRVPNENSSWHLMEYYTVTDFSTGFLTLIVTFISHGDGGKKKNIFLFLPFFSCKGNPRTINVMFFYPVLHKVLALKNIQHITENFWVTSPKILEFHVFAERFCSFQIFTF